MAQYQRQLTITHAYTGTWVCPPPLQPPHQPPQQQPPHQPPQQQQSTTSALRQKPTSRCRPSPYCRPGNNNVNSSRETQGIYYVIIIL